MVGKGKGGRDDVGSGEIPEDKIFEDDFSLKSSSSPSPAAKDAERLKLEQLIDQYQRTSVDARTYETPEDLQRAIADLSQERTANRETAERKEGELAAAELRLGELPKYEQLGTVEQLQTLQGTVAEFTNFYSDLRTAANALGIDANETKYQQTADGLRNLHDDLISKIRADAQETGSVAGKEEGKQETVPLLDALNSRVKDLYETSALRYNQIFTDMKFSKGDSRTYIDALSALVNLTLVEAKTLAEENAKYQKLHDKLRARSTGFPDVQNDAAGLNALIDAEIAETEQLRTYEDGVRGLNRNLVDYLNGKIKRPTISQDATPLDKAKIYIDTLIRLSGDRERAIAGLDAEVKKQAAENTRLSVENATYATAHKTSPGLPPTRSGDTAIIDTRAVSDEKAKASATAGAGNGNGPKTTTSATSTTTARKRNGGLIYGIVGLVAGGIIGLGLANWYQTKNPDANLTACIAERKNIEKELSQVSAYHYFDMVQRVVAQSQLEDISKRLATTEQQAADYQTALATAQSDLEQQGIAAKNLAEQNEQLSKQLAENETLRTTSTIPADYERVKADLVTCITKLGQSGTANAAELAKCNSSLTDVSSQYTLAIADLGTAAAQLSEAQKKAADLEAKLAQATTGQVAAALTPTELEEKCEADEVIARAVAEHYLTGNPEEGKKLCRDTYAPAAKPTQPEQKVPKTKIKQTFCNAVSGTYAYTSKNSLYTNVFGKGIDALHGQSFYTSANSSMQLKMQREISKLASIVVDDTFKVYQEAGRATNGGIAYVACPKKYYY